MRRSAPYSNRLRAGFTLIELLIVMVLLLLLALIAAPEVRSALFRSQLDGATRAVQTVTSRARQAAVVHQSRVVVLTGQTTPASAGAPPSVYVLAYSLDTGGLPLQLEMRSLPQTLLEGPPGDLAASVGLSPVDTSTWPAVESPEGPLTLSATGMVFLTNGAIEQAGAWRLAHRAERTVTLGNGTERQQRFDYRELRVIIPATGRVVALHYDLDLGAFERPRPAVS